MTRLALWMLVGAAGLAAPCAVGCWAVQGRSPWAAECREVPAPKQQARAAPSKPAPAHADFTRLLAYRNYYKLDRVEPFAHHFAVWFHCIESSVAYYAVSPDGAVTTAGGAWGGLALRDGKPKEVPEAMRAAAKLALDTLDAEYEHESGARVEYLGSYREVVISEIVPMSGSPSDPYARMMQHTTVTLRADAALKTIDGFASAEGGETRICWKDIVVTDCGPATWVDFAPNTGGGQQLLPALVAKGSPSPEAEKSRFAEVALAAARSHIAGEPGAPLDRILARQGSSALPPGFAPPLTVSFTIYARVRDPAPPGGPRKQQDASLKITLPTLELLRKGAHGEGSTTIGGLGISAVVDVTPTPPPAPDAGVPTHAALRLHYTLKDSRGNERSADVTLTGEVMSEGDSAVLTLSPLPGEIANRTHDPPLAQHFPGSVDYAMFDAYVGFSSGYARWWP